MMGPNRWLSPAAPDTITTLADQGCRSLLVVPISFVTDHVNTSYDLDIAVRAEAEARGIDHFEVTSGLNTHPLFIEALGEATIAQLRLPVDINQRRTGDNGRSKTYPLRPYQQLPRHDLNGQLTHCPDCGAEDGARRWTHSGRSSDLESRPASSPSSEKRPVPNESNAQSQAS
jgi:ferrochelatase